MNRNKLNVTLLLILGTILVFAQEESVIDSDFQIENIRTKIAFEEIPLNELPKAVTAAVKVGYPQFPIKKAYVNQEKHYKMEVPVEAGEVLFFLWTKMEIGLKCKYVITI